MRKKKKKILLSLSLFHSLSHFLVFFIEAAKDPIFLFFPNNYR